MRINLEVLGDKIFYICIKQNIYLFLSYIYIYIYSYHIYVVAATLYVV